VQNQQAVRKRQDRQPSPRAEIKQSAVRSAAPSDAEVPSPAIAIQQELDRQLRAQAGGAEPARWSTRSTLVFSASVSLALWAAIAAAAYAALR
jgi:hypothetical protein